jgi:hypothetical protein
MHYKSPVQYILETWDTNSGLSARRKQSTTHKERRWYLPPPNPETMETSTPTFGVRSAHHALGRVRLAETRRDKSMAEVSRILWLPCINQHP